MTMGLGLFAASDIKVGTFLGEYTGLLQNEADVCGAGAAAADGYKLRYPAPGLHVSAREMGSLLRFANHAAGSAANVDFVPQMLDGAWHMCAVSLANIATGAQLFVDYGDDYWAARGSSSGQELTEVTAK